MEVHQSTRVERLRRMIEENVEDPQLFSPRFVSRAPADLAAQRFLHKGQERGAKFDLTSVFSDLRLSVVKAVEHGDEVTISWRLRGKWTGALPFAPDLKPNRTAVDFTGTNVYHFVGDKVVSKTGLFDTPTLVRQMVAGGGFSAEECQRAIVQVGDPAPEILAGEGGLERLV